MLDKIPLQLRPLLILALLLAVSALGASRLVAQPQLQIVFMSDRDGNLESYLMQADGSGQHNLTNHPAADGGASWSESLKVYAFISTRNGGEPRLFTMNRQGGDQQQAIGQMPLNVSVPEWSPDGRLVAFTSEDNDNLDVYIFDPLSGVVHNVTSHPGQERFGDWSPDSRQILFTSDRDGFGAIYKVGIDGHGETRLTDPESPNALPTWSPDGKQIAFLSARDDNIEMYVMDADGGNATRLTDNPGLDTFPRWSPDGKKIAFLSDREGNVEIFVVNADGTNMRNLTMSPAQESVQGDFAWSPDGQLILFTSDRSGDVEIFVMRADGSEQRNLSNHLGVDFSPAWVR